MNKTSIAFAIALSIASATLFEFVVKPAIYNQIEGT